MNARKLDNAKDWSIKIGLFLLAFGLLYALSQKCYSRGTRKSARNDRQEVVWVKSQVDMLANQEGISFRDSSTMKCSVTDTHEYFLMTCKNQYGVEDFKLVKVDKWGKWSRRGTEKDPIGGKFSVAKVPNKEKYLGEVYTRNGTPAPFELTPLE